MADLSNKPFLKQIRDMLIDGVRRIDNDECDERQALKMVAEFNIETDEQFCKKRFVNYDKAMKMVGIKGRTVFKRLCDERGIEQHLVNNMKVGFLRSDIEDLAQALRKETKKARK